MKYITILSAFCVAPLMAEITPDKNNDQDGRYIPSEHFSELMTEHKIPSNALDKIIRDGIEDMVPQQNI